MLVLIIKKYPCNGAKPNPKIQNKLSNYNNHTYKHQSHTDPPPRNEPNIKHMRNNRFSQMHTGVQNAFKSLEYRNSNAITDICDCTQGIFRRMQHRRRIRVQFKLDIGTGIYFDCYHEVYYKEAVTPAVKLSVRSTRHEEVTQIKDECQISGVVELACGRNRVLRLSSASRR
jgi:hypothetical protein